jgi:BlaI family penicillinase repressor
MFAGDPHKMVAQLLSNEQLDNSEIEQLENILAAHKIKNNK